MPTAIYQGNPALGAVARPQPSTTQEAPGGPWIRHARPASRPGYNTSGLAFGFNITQPLPSAPGYLRYLDLVVQASGGVNGTTTVAVTADAPFNAVSFIQLKDPWGTPVFYGDGYSLLYLVAKFGGQRGLLGYADITSLPSYSAPSTGSIGTGNFTFHTAVPMEATKGYGCMSIGNASVMPTLEVIGASSATIYSTAPGTLPTVALTVDESYYDIDPASPVEPPGNGSTLQWSVVTGNQTVGSSSSTRVQLPRTGGYLTTLILVLRDSTGARIDGYNTTGRLRVYVDGVPKFDEQWNEVIDRIANEFQTSRPTGVVAYTFKTSVAQVSLGLLDTLETSLQTNPGTLIEVEMTPWGSITNSPAQLQAIIGQIVPVGPLAQGLGEA